MTETHTQPSATGADTPDLRSRGEFMAEAATLLAGSLDYHEALDTLAHLSVPRVADWCAIDEVDDEGRIRRIAVAHPDPERERIARELEERYPPDPRAPHGVPNVLRTGRAELVPEIPDALLEAAARDEAHLRLIRTLGLRSYMVVPLKARGRMLGAISFVSSESGRRFTTSDLAFAEELASRAALAVDNARLLGEAEAARRQTERILESITDAFFALDRTWRFTYLNDEAERLLGRPRAALLGRSIWDVFPEAAGGEFQHRYEEALREQRTVEFETHFASRDAWLEVRAYPGEEGLSVYLRDATARIRAQRALEASEERFRFQSETVPAQVWTALPDGGLDYVSHQAASYFGMTAERLLDEGWHDVVHPDDLAAAGERWARSLATGEPYEVEFRLRGADGSYRWHLARAVSKKAPDGSVEAWFGVNTDVEDRRRTEQELERLVAHVRSERERLADLFRDAPAFIAVLEGPEHRFRLANAAYRQLVGHRDVVGRTVAEALPEVVEQGFVDILDGVYHGGEPFVGSELDIRLQRTPDAASEQRYVNFVYQPVREADNAVSGIFVHGVDVTDQVVARRETERKAEELARLARALEASNAELDQFAYVASHDLKAPLRGIGNLSQWIEEDLGPDVVTGETREHLELLRGRVRRMEGLIDGILQYSRAGRVRERSESVDTGALMAEVLDLLDPPEDVAIEVQAEMPTVVAERLPLQQVFMNLVGNALKYARVERPRVEIGARAEGAEWEFHVADNGPGIAPEYHERIFGIFQTLKPRDEVEGTGIGLSLVRKIVESRGGRVWVESEEGRGATFRFRIPRDPPGGAA